MVLLQEMGFLLELFDDLISMDNGKNRCKTNFATAHYYTEKINPIQIIFTEVLHPVKRYRWLNSFIFDFEEKVLYLK